VDLVPAALVFGVLGIDEVGMLDAITVDQREAVDIGFLGDRAGFLGRDALSAGGPRQQRLAEHGSRQRRRADERISPGECYGTRAAYVCRHLALLPGIEEARLVTDRGILKVRDYTLV
jgi:hypothetical protein